MLQHGPQPRLRPRVAAFRSAREISEAVGGSVGQCRELGPLTEVGCCEHAHRFLPAGLGGLLLDEGIDGETDRDGGDGCTARDPSALAVGCGAPARSDEGRLRLGELRRRGRARVAPVFRFADGGAAQQETRRPAGGLPFAGGFTVAGVCADPSDIDGEGIGEAGQVRRLFLRRAHEDVVEALQALGHVGRVARDDRQDALALQLGVVDLPVADIGRYRIRTDQEHHRIGGLDQPTEARLPVFAGSDVVLVEIGVETLGAQRGVEPVGGLTVLAGIGDEDIGFALARAGRFGQLNPRSSRHGHHCRPWRQSLLPVLCVGNHGQIRRGVGSRKANG